jgi:hypothetical protein
LPEGMLCQNFLIPFSRHYHIFLKFPLFFVHRHRCCST